ncbi:MAG: 8-amino-7-oxononanoate synthase, partial [Flavobacterium macrobrachii]
MWGDFIYTLDEISFKIFNSVKELPSLWDTVAQSNVFLQKPYLTVLEKSSPVNMECFYIGIFEKSTLIGVSLAQYLDLNKLESFGERDKCF